MASDQEELFKRLSDAVVAMDETETVRLAREVVTDRHDPYATIEKGLVDGMDRSENFSKQSNTSSPELLMCADAMYAGWIY